MRISFRTESDATQGNTAEQYTLFRPIECCDFGLSKFEAGGPSLHCTIPTEGAPSLRLLQGWAAMLPAQLLSVLHRPLCMPSSYPSFSPTRRTGHPHLWWLLQFESRATRPAHP